MDRRPVDQKLESLLGARIVRTLGGESGLALFFDNGFTLTIYSPVRLQLDGSGEIEPSQMTNRRLENIVCGPAKVLIEIEGQIRLEIDLDERKMTGPEHLQLRSKQGEITVWR